MKPMVTIGGWEALVRVAIIVVGSVLAIVLVAGVLRLIEAPERTVSLVVFCLALVALVGGMVLAGVWALIPWLLPRFEARVWEGKVKLDHHEALRRSGMG